jgi:hypothetical protein
LVEGTETGFGAVFGAASVFFSEDDLRGGKQLVYQQLHDAGLRSLRRGRFLRLAAYRVEMAERCGRDCEHNELLMNTGS